MDIIDVLRTAEAYNLEHEELQSMVKSYIERKSYTLKKAVTDSILVNKLIKKKNDM